VTLVSVEQVGETRHHEVLRFQAHPSHVRTCRHDVIGKLRDWRTPVRLGDVERLVSEIVTNAILYGAPADRVDTWVQVELEETARGLLVHVRNNGAEWKPKAGNPADLAESGRGLLLVGELAEDWGHESGQDSTSVHFLVRYLDAASDEPFAAEELGVAESGTSPDASHEMSRSCDKLTIRARWRSSHDAKSTRRIKCSLAISTRAMGSVHVAICCLAPSHSPARRSNASIWASWPNSPLRWPTPLCFRGSPRSSRPRPVGTLAVAAFGSSVICAPLSECLQGALYWGGRKHLGRRIRIRGPMDSRDQHDHRACVESIGSRT